MKLNLGGVLILLVGVVISDIVAADILFRCLLQHHVQ